MVQYFQIPGTLPSLNEANNASRTSKYVGAKLKKDTEAIIILAIKAWKIKPVKKLSKITFHWFESDESRPPHEIITGKSLIMEALLETGIIPTLGWDLYESSWNIVDYWHTHLDPGVGVIIYEAADD